MNLFSHLFDENLFLVFRKINLVKGRIIPVRGEAKKWGYEFQIDSNTHPYVQRVTIAHELGHRFLAVYPNHRFPAIYSQMDWEIAEYRCDLIAMSILCPKEILEDTLRKEYYRIQGQPSLPFGAYATFKGTDSIEARVLVRTAGRLRLPLTDLIPYIKILFPGMRLRAIVSLFDTTIPKLSAV